MTTTTALHSRPRRRPRSFSQRFWEDKNGNLNIWQKPNAALITWFVCNVLSLFMPLGPIERFISFVGALAIVLWAILELVWGESYFRRLLGFLVLLSMSASRFM